MAPRTRGVGPTQRTSGTLTFGPGENERDVLDSATRPLERGDRCDSQPLASRILRGPRSAATSSAVLTIVNPTHRAPDDFDGDGRSDLGRGPTEPGPLDRQSIHSRCAHPDAHVRRTGAGGTSPSWATSTGSARAEVGYFRPSTAQWWVLGPNGAHLVGTFGAPNGVDIPVPGNYDGIGPHGARRVSGPRRRSGYVLGPRRRAGCWEPSAAQTWSTSPCRATTTAWGHTEMAVCSGRRRPSGS